MPFTIIRNDITKVDADAIVNSTNRWYHADGGADLVIHKAAGCGLDKACEKLVPLEVGTVQVTEGFNLKAKYIIHTSAPVWNQQENSEELLRKCYVESLNAAKERGCQSVAFPLISSGVYGCPKDVALKIAMDSIRDFLFENEMTVYLVVYDKKAFQISTKLFENVQAFIDDNYVADRRDNMPFSSSVSYLPPEADVRFGKSRAYETSEDIFRESSEAPIEPGERECSDAENLIRHHFIEKRDIGQGCQPAQRQIIEGIIESKVSENSRYFHTLETETTGEENRKYPSEEYMPDSGNKEVETDASIFLVKPGKLSPEGKDFILDESFSDMLFRKIDEKGIADAEVYKKAGVSKQVFSNIKSKQDYIPNNTTVLAFAVALELNLQETEEMLAKAGYALSPSRLFDVIVRYFIENGTYDIFEINATLFQFDQKLLGSK